MEIVSRKVEEIGQVATLNEEESYVKINNDNTNISREQLQAVLVVLLREAQSALSKPYT